MAIRDFVEYVKDGRGIRIVGPEGVNRGLRYRVINLCSPAQSDQKAAYKPVGKESIEFKNHCVVELTDGKDRFLAGPQRPDVRPIPQFSDEKPRLSFNRDAPPIHMSRLWLQNESDGARFFLGNQSLDARISWRFDRGPDRFRFCMDEYCKAYYEGI